MKMSSYINLSQIFGCVVRKVSALSQKFGLRIQLAYPTDLGKIFGGGDQGYRNRDICELADRHGVLVIDNAFVKKEPDLLLSGMREREELVQDPFHWDSPIALPDGTGCANVLFKLLSDERIAPTLYARIQDVRAALKQVDTSSFSAEAKEALREMSLPGYFFGLGGEENEARQTLLFKAPTLTEQVAGLNPAGEAL